MLSSCETPTLQNVLDADQIVAKNNTKIAIKTGVSGTLLKIEGDCMPTRGISTCKEYPVSRTLYVYEYTTFLNVVGYGPLYYTVNSKLIGLCTADTEGFFQIALLPGKYSIFIKENDGLYANGLDGQGGINPVTVKTDSVSSIKLMLSYAVY